MFNLISADLFKIRKSISIKVLVAITALCAVAMTVMARLIPQGALDKSVSSLVFLFSDINVAGILVGVIAGIFICGDFENQTIHDAIAGGHGRGSVLISRTVTFYCSVLAILLPYAIVTSIALGTGAKFGPVSPSGTFLHLLTAPGAPVSGAQAGKLIAVIITLIVLYAGQMSICIPLAIVLKKPVLVIAINYGVQILCGQLAQIAHTSSSFNTVYSLTPYGTSYMQAALNTPAGDLVKSLAVSAGFMLIMVLLAYTAFRKAEIK